MESTPSPKITCGIGGHHSPVMQNDEWLTPPELLKPLGVFDLDPCSPVVRPWPTADNHFTKEDDGLSKPWVGRVWCNPPYGKHAAIWLQRLAEHPGGGIALTFARTETEMWFKWVWSKASAILFIKGRLHFHHVDGRRAPANSGAPSALIGYGTFEAQVLRRCGIRGALWFPS